jgi:hypothetical protein
MLGVASGSVFMPLAIRYITSVCKVIMAYRGNHWYECLCDSVRVTRACAELCGDRNLCKICAVVRGWFDALLKTFPPPQRIAGGVASPHQILVVILWCYSPRDPADLF